MSHKKTLKEYRKKRDFDTTTEPFGEESSKKDKDKQIFVIQKHKASSLHYDLRLSVNAVLKSWAVPKGPSTDPDEKRLAIPTEDHPLEYADFEGVIPEDKYGGGTVMVWDAGTYDNITKDDDGNPIALKDQLKSAQKYTVDNIFRRLSQKSDPWKGMSRHAVTLKKARNKLELLKIKA